MTINSKPVLLFIFCGTQNKIFSRMYKLLMVSMAMQILSNTKVVQYSIFVRVVLSSSLNNGGVFKPVPGGPTSSRV